jgi:hypothetical protein
MDSDDLDVPMFHINNSILDSQEHDMHGRVSSCEEGESEDYDESSDGEVRGIDQDFSVHVAATTSSLHTSPPRMHIFLQCIHTEARVRTPGSNIGEGSSGVRAPARTL